MWLAARWRRALGARPAPRRRHRRSWLACRGRARGARRQAAGAQPRARRIAPCAGRGAKPKTGLPAAARAARYRLLAQARAGARRHAYPHRAYPRRPGRDAVDAAVARQRHCRALRRWRGRRERDGVMLARPFLNVSKSRLVATLQKAKIAFADDPTNRDTAFHAAAAARADAAACGRGRRCPQSGAAGRRGSAGPMPRWRCWSTAPSAIWR